MMRKKPHIERSKAIVEKHLVARLEMLKSKGISEMHVQRDATVRHYKGEIRRAKERLASIAELERLMERKAEIKAEKMAAPKIEHPKKRHETDPVKKKAKMERKLVTVEEDEE
jgi:hypothetical protein